MDFISYLMSFLHNDELREKVYVEFPLGLVLRFMDINELPNFCKSKEAGIIYAIAKTGRALVIKLECDVERLAIEVAEAIATGGASLAASVPRPGTDGMIQHKELMPLAMPMVMIRKESVGLAIKAAEIELDMPVKIPFEFDPIQYILDKMAEAVQGAMQRNGALSKIEIIPWNTIPHYYYEMKYEILKERGK